MKILQTGLTAVLLWVSLFLSVPATVSAAQPNGVTFVIKLPASPTRVYLRMPDDSARDADCEAVSSSANTYSYHCEIEEIATMTSVDRFGLSIEAANLDLRPIPIRIYPSMPVSKRIDINLMDEVFRQDFIYSKNYGDKWGKNQSDRFDDHGLYLITRNLHFKFNVDVDEVKVYVLSKYLERAWSVAGRVQFAAIDPAVGPAIDTLVESAQRPFEREILDKYGFPDRPLRRTALEKLRLADWYIFAAALKASPVEVDRRQDDFCRLFKAFQSLWNEASPGDKSLISNLWPIGGSFLTDPTKSRTFTKCPS